MTEIALTVDEVAGRLKATTRTIRTWITTGRLPAVKVGRKWLITESTIDQILRGEIEMERLRFEREMAQGEREMEQRFLGESEREKDRNDEEVSK